MSYDAPTAVQYAQSQVGFHETPDGSNCNPYSDWQYGVRCPGGGWCISFASRCTVEGGFRFDGATHGDRGFSYTEAAEAWARPRGLWRDRSWRAQPGDWVIFDWNGDGRTDHGEVVHTDDGQWLVLIGGNTSNAVKWRKRDRTYVVGFVAFSQSDQVVAPPPPPPKVRPMYDPAKPLRARLQHPDGGWWEAYSGGKVDFLSSVKNAAVLAGGMTSDADRKKCEGKTVARLHPRDYTRDGVTHHGYVIEFSDGSTAFPEAQKNT